MIKNNNVAQDTQGERIERLTLLSANIGVYGPLIGIAGPKLAAAQTAFDDYVGAVAEAGIQDGQMPTKLTVKPSPIPRSSMRWHARICRK